MEFDKGHKGQCYFIRKATNLEEVEVDTKKIRVNSSKKESFIIEKVIELSTTQYEAFSQNLLDDRDFISEHLLNMGVDQNGIWHCILVKETTTNATGILINSEGYSYARYVGILD